MYRLRRRVRFAINPPGLTGPPGPNGYAGNPPVRGSGRWSELVVECAAPLGEKTQYVINIKDIDQAFRASVLPELERASHDRPEADAAELVPLIARGLARAVPVPVDLVRWHVSPYHSVEMRPADMSTVLLRQRFDFCAAHRLHNSALSAEENVRLFGKCNNPSGHGHNYQFEPCVEVPAERAARGFTLHELERLAEDEIIRRFDHKNLNADTAEFKDGVGVMPSVEQISRVIYELLGGAMRRAGAGATLRSVTVWESDRTSCTYPA